MLQVYERVGKSAIWVCERAKELTDDFYGFIKLKNVFFFGDCS